MTVTKDTQDDSNLQAQITITPTVLYTGCHYCRRDPHRHVQLRYVPPTILHHGLADLCNGLADCLSSSFGWVPSFCLAALFPHINNFAIPVYLLVCWR